MGYSTISVSNANALDIFFNNFDQSIDGTRATVMAWRIVQFNEIMGKDADIVGTLAGDTGTEGGDRHALEQYFSDNQWTPQVVQVKLSPDNMSATDWMSLPEALAQFGMQPTQEITS